MSSKERPLAANASVTVVEADRVEPVTTNADLEELIRKEKEAEAFANELVTIRIAKTTDKNKPDHVILSVNGKTQVVVAGRKQTVRRMYLEVLARMWESAYEQKQHAIELDRYEMLETPALVYPFEVLNDANPKGAAWLEHILAEKN